LGYHPLRYLTLLDGPFQEANLHAFISAVEATISEALEEDPNSGISGSVAGRFEELRRWVSNRVVEVRAQVERNERAAQISPLGLECAPVPAVPVEIVSVGQSLPAGSGVSLFPSTRQHGLEMRGLLFVGDNGYLNLLEPGLFQPPVQFAF
jgi:hypothetical protein